MPIRPRSKKEKNAEIVPARKNGQMATYKSDDVEVEMVDQTLAIIRKKSTSPMSMIPALTSPEERLLRDRRKFSSGPIPQFQCNTCPYTSQCQYFKPGYECAFTELIDEHKLTSQEDILYYLLAIAEMDIKRLQRAVINEQLEGSLNSATSKQLAETENRLHRLYKSIEEERTRTMVMPRPMPAVQQVQAFVNARSQQDGPENKSLLRELMGILQTADRTIGGE